MSMTREQVQPGQSVEYSPMEGVSCIAVIDGEPWQLGAEPESAWAVVVSQLPPEFTQMTGRGIKSGKCITTLAYISAIEEEKPPLFRFTRFNPRRFARGAEAAEVECHGEPMWCSRDDLELNVRDFGEHPELMKALEAYKTPRIEFRHESTNEND